MKYVIEMNTIVKYSPTVSEESTSVLEVKDSLNEAISIMRGIEETISSNIDKTDTLILHSSLDGKKIIVDKGGNSSRVIVEFHLREESSTASELKSVISQINRFVD